MAASRKPGPLGIDATRLAPTGTLSRSAPPGAGSVGFLTVPATGPAGERCPGTIHEDHHSKSVRWIADWEGVRPGASRGFVRLALPGEWAAGCRRVDFATAEDAAKAAERLAQDAVATRALQTLCNLTGRPLIAWAAKNLRSGELTLLWRRRSEQRYAPIAAPAPPPSPVQRHRPAPSGPSPAYATFPPDFDAAAVAQSLKDAAQDGVPFCEECRKAQETQAQASGEAA